MNSPPPTSTNYLTTIQNYFRSPNKYRQNLLDFYETHFDARISYTFLNILLPNYKLTLNTLLWSFSHDKLLPIYSVHADKDKDDIRKRDEYALAIQEQLKKYSFSRAFVEKQVEDIIYFAACKDENKEKSTEKIYTGSIGNRDENGNSDKKAIYGTDKKAILSFWKKYNITPPKGEKKDFFKTFQVGFFDLIQTDNSIEAIYLIPIITGLKDRYIGGVFAINSDQQIEGAKLKLIQTYVSGMYDEHQMQEIEYLLNKEKGKSKSEKEKSARANINFGAVSIISRNISHNLGSHVFSYLKDSLRTTSSMLEKEVFAGILKKDEETGLFTLAENLPNYQKKQESNTASAEYLLGINMFLESLQERQDYIATIASAQYPYYAPANFLEVIFDAFNFDKRAERDPENHEKCKNLLLDYIVRSEGYRREEISIKFRGYDGSQLPEGFIEKDLEYMRKLTVLLPSGIMGRQAIFSMLENIIRNTAKHGKRKSNRNGKLEIILDVINYDEDFYKMTITDNSGNTNQRVIDKLNSIIKGELVDENGILKEENKGLKEIQIAAAWLRGIAPYKMSQDRDLPILSVKNKNNSVSYEFYLRKPQIGLIITENKILKRNIQKLAHWKALSFSETIDKQKFYYKFVVIDARKKYEEKQITTLQMKSPLRFFEYDFQSESELLTKALIMDTQWGQKLHKTIYQYWLNNYFVKGEGKKIDDYRLTIIDKIDKSHETKDLGINWYTTTNTEILTRIGSDIIFRNHNDNLQDFEKFKKLADGTIYKKASFIEGISGSNATNRLIRQEKIDDVWRYKIMESALTKVLIIDERIWTNITKRRPETNTTVPINDILLEISKLEENTKITEDLKHKIHLIRENLKIKHPFRGNIFDTWIKRKTYQNVLKFAPYLTKDKEADGTGNLFEYEKYLKKNITIVNIEKDEGKEGQRDTFSIKDLCNIVVGRIDRRARLFDAKEKFHYVSVHQGILDKISAANRGSTIQEAIKMLQKGIDGKRFLIHSGRSAIQAIPEDCSFIQYSSLENSLLDCKFTLTELLFSSTY